MIKCVLRTERGTVGYAQMQNECPSDVVRDIRNLNRRTARLERFALLVSVDSFRALSASQNSPQGYRFLRSPRLHCVPLGMTYRGCCSVRAMKQVGEEIIMNYEL